MTATMQPAAAASTRYGTVDDRIVSELARIVGDKHVLVAEGDLEAYSRDATPLFHARPDCVVQPETTEQVAAIMALATAHRIPVIPRGAGSNLAAATLAEHGGIVLALSRMRSIREVAPDELLAVVEPGVTTNELDLAANAHGLFYAPDPGSKTVSTVGGNVAMCAGGLRGLKYGVTRNYVLGLEVVLPTGEIIRTGGRLWKDVAGYDLTRLLTGSEGTLGVITEVTVALIPSPATSRTGVAYFDTLHDASTAVAAIIADGVVPATLEFLDERCIAAVDEFAKLGLDREAGALLLFGDDGSAETAASSLGRMADVAAANKARDVTLARDIAEAESLLYARRCSLPALARLGPITMLEDATVPRPKLAHMVDVIGEIADKHGVVCSTFGHAGDGNLHPTVVLDPADEGAVDAANATFDDVFAAALTLGGTITGEHGVGAAKRAWLDARLGSDQMSLLRRIKTAFDPAGILNPGKLGS
jgi:glycolate oxidase